MKKLKKNTGFTLAEVLIAVTILVMITAGIMPATVRAYQNAVDAANAQVLLSTTVNALRGELSTAWNVKPVAGATDAITYQSADTGSQTKMYKKDKKIMLQEYNDFSEEWLDNDAVAEKPEERPLIQETMSKTTQNPRNNMTVVYSAVNCADGYVSFSGLEVKRGETTIAKMSGDLIIRPLGGENG